MLLFSVHFQFTSFLMVNSTLPLYIEEARQWEIGIVVGAMGIISIGLRPFTGRWVDRVGRGPLLVLGAAILLAAFASYAITDAIVPLTAVRLAHGAGMTIYTTAALTLVADLAPDTRRGEAVGFLNMANNATQVYAPLAAFAIADHLGFTPLFGVSVGSATASLAAAGMLRDPFLRRRAAEARASSTPAAPPNPLLTRSAFQPSSVLFPFTVAMASIWAFLPLLAKDRDLGDPGLFFTLFGLMLVIVRPLAGLASDRWGRAFVIIPGLALGALSMAVLGAANSQAVFLLAAVLFGAGFAMGHTGLMALAVDRSSAHERGAAMATFALTWDVGATTGPILLGVMAAASGYGSVYMIAAGLIVAGLLNYVVVVRTPAPAARRPVLGDGSPGV